MFSPMKNTFTALFLIVLVTNAYSHEHSGSENSQEPGIKHAINLAANGKHRSAKNIARNQYRHPAQTLYFFGLEKNMTVLEISPGGLWYTEVLAPVLKNEGKLIVAGYDVQVPDQPKFRYRQQKAMEQRFRDEADVFGEVEIVKFSPPDSVQLGANNSVDMVVTFRNFHGWIRDELAADNVKAFYNVLKPGGILGVVQHRIDKRTTREDGGINGYVTEAEIVALAEAAGFKLDAKSEINANPKDTKDYANGVWTLPPILTLGEVDQAKYLAIGESDRMTLRFVKP